MRAYVRVLPNWAPSTRIKKMIAAMMVMMTTMTKEKATEDENEGKIQRMMPGANESIGAIHK